MKRLERLERQLAQQTQPPVEDVRIFHYPNAWLGRFDYDIMMANLAVVPEPTPAEDEVDRE